MTRLYNLDYLRGIAALGIMLYHYYSWAFEHFKADDFMGRVGVYGVSIFYVLSGLTLYYVYYDKMKPTFREVKCFFVKRFFRIFPLLWLVTITAIILSKKAPNFFDVFLNLTGLFGVVSWNVTFSPWVWSIGNELVFYLFFPFFVLLTKYNKILLYLLLVLLFSFYIYFAFFELKSNELYANQFRIYSNPLNQVFLFLCGFLIGLLFSKKELNIIVLLIVLLFGFLTFVFWPAEGNPINLVTGINRIVFTFSCLLIVFALYKLRININKSINIVHKVFVLLGEISYSVYLIHPLMYKLVKQFLGINPTTLSFTLLLTLVVSYFVYRYFEKNCMKLGGNLLKINDAKRL
ncbi:MAG: acyltransferase [Bacteroidia bacterium]|nr:acyltransferase [Bacteroidia bacterium]